jgi:poly(hydroxyalkanoate) depolymerase family esterase
MNEALRLTREGRLQEAMAVLLGKPDHDEAPQEATAKNATAIIDMIAPSSGGDVWTTPGGETDRTAGVDRKITALHPGRARFEDLAFANGAGSRRYRLYVPARYSGRPLPLVLMLHGCTQSAEDFAAGTRMNELAEEQGFLVAYPQQSEQANASRCWNWFNGSEQRRGQGEPSLIAGITQQVIHDFAVDGARVYVAGLSAGGAAAVTMGATYPDLYAAVGVHSGLPCGAASNLPTAFAAMRQGPAASAHLKPTTVPTIVFHGDADSTVNPVNAEQIIGQVTPAAGLQSTTLRGTSAGGVSYIRTTRTDVSRRPVVDQWLLQGAGHAWAGGSAAGSYTDARGPDASREMAHFFLQHALDPQRPQGNRM